MANNNTKKKLKALRHNQRKELAGAGYIRKSTKAKVGASNRHGH